MTNYKTIRFMSPLTLLGLAACSGGGSSVTQAGGGGGQAAVFNIGGNANKGPLQGAIAFIDANGNNIADAGEVQATTLADGSYILEAPTATARVVVVSTDATIDTSSGAAVTDLVMAAPAGATMVTPLTTLIDASPTLSVTELQSALGITADPLTFNPFADGADAAQAVAAEKAAQQIASTVLTATKVTGGDASALSASVKALASALETAANRGGADAKFDFADADEITAVLNAAATTASVDISASVATLAGSIANVNQVMEDTLVDGVNLTSSDIKNALATVNQFTAAIAELDAADIAGGISSAAVGGFDDLETVKAAVKNSAPTDIKLDGFLISSDPEVDAIGTAEAVDGDQTANGSKIYYTLLGDDAEFFKINANTGDLAVDRDNVDFDADAFAAKSSFSIAIKATDYIDDGTAGVTFTDGKVDADSLVSIGKAYVEAFTIVKQNEKALVVSESLTLKDYDVANNSAESPGADEVALAGTVSDGTLTIASDPVKLNLQNLKALAEGDGGQSPIVALTLSKVPVTSGDQTALLRLTLTDGSDGSADEGERVVSLDVKLNYSGDGTNLTLSLPSQEVEGYYVGSDGTKVQFEGLENSGTDVLTLSDGKLTAPTSLDVKIASLISLAKENASVDLLQAGKYHLSLSLIDDDSYDGLTLQAATGENITSINMGINIVDEGEIFQLAGNSVTVSSDGEDQVLEAEASGGVLSVTQNVEFEESEIKALSAGLGELPSFSFELSKVANTTGDVKVRLSLMDGSDTKVITGERAISFDVDLKWDADASTFTLADGDILGDVTLSDGTVVEDVTINNAAADVLAIRPSSNSLSGSSLSVKLGGLVAATSEFASIDLLAIGNYTLQVETLDGVQLFDATGEEISKVQATVAVVADAPLDVIVTPVVGEDLTVAENTENTSIIANLSAKNRDGVVDTATFKIVDSDGAFEIDGNNLVVKDATKLNHEVSDTLQVKIQASGGGRTGTETFKVDVSDVNDAPVAPSSGLELQIGSGASAGAVLYSAVEASEFELVATDEDGDTLTYSITSQTLDDADVGGLFEMDGGNVVLTRPVDNDDVGDYKIIVEINDGTDTTSTTLTAKIIENNAPTLTDGGTAWDGLSIDEDAIAGTKVLNGAKQAITFSGTDVETDDSALTFEVVGSSNFTIDADGYLVLKTGASINFEAKETEQISVVAKDENGAASDPEILTITIGDVNEAPTIDSGASGETLLEFARPDGTAVYDADATDVDDPANTITFSLGGDDKDKFAIDASTGIVTLASNLDGISSNGSYAFTVTADDGEGGTDTVDVTGTVTDQVDVPFSIFGATETDGKIVFNVIASSSALDNSYDDFDTITLANPTQLGVSVFKIGDGSEVTGTAKYTGAGDGLKVLSDAKDVDDGFDRALDIDIQDYTTALLAWEAADTNLDYDPDENGGVTVADLLAAKDAAEDALRAALADSAPASTAENNISPQLDVSSETEDIIKVTFTPTETLEAGTYAVALSTKFSLSDSSGVAEMLEDIVGEDIWVTVDIA